MKIKLLVTLVSTLTIGCVGITPRKAVRYESDVVKVEVQRVFASNKRYRAKVAITNKQNRSVMWHMQSMECYQGDDKGVVSFDVIKRKDQPAIYLKPGEKFNWSVHCLLSKSTPDYHTNYTRRLVINGIYVNPDSMGLVQGDELEKKVEFNLYDSSDIQTEKTKPANLVISEKEDDGVPEVIKVKAEPDSEKEVPTVQKEKPSHDTFKKAKKCQSKGGVWVNDVCQLDIDGE